VRTTKGEQTREFNYVTNLVDGLVAAAVHEGDLPDPINLASGEEVPIATLVTKIAALTETKSKVEIGALPYRPTEIWRMYADSSRAREKLGWKPAINLDQGLERTVAWYRKYLAEQAH